MGVAHFASCCLLIVVCLSAFVGATRVRPAHLDIESIVSIQPFTNMTHPWFVQPILDPYPPYNHVSIQPFTPGNVDQFEGLDLACFCKRVKDMSECFDKDDVHNPSGPHFAHNGGESCCKLGSTSMFSWKGLGYEQQEDLMLCMAETRPVPANSCCRLQDALGSVGVRISKAYSSNKVIKGYQSDFAGWRDLDKKAFKYLKTPPEFTLADITSAQDHNEQEVKGDMASKFIQTLLDAGRFGGKLECGGTGGSWTKLFEGKGACQLRTEEWRAGTSQPCCCHKNSLPDPVRSCVPIPGAPDETGMQQIVGSTYEERHTNEFFSNGSGLIVVGKVTRAKTDDPENAMPKFMKGERNVAWNWQQATNQWKETCKIYREVLRKAIGFGPDYPYAKGSQCVEWQKDWRCGPGQGLYNPIKAEGQCMNAPVIPDSLVFECPPDYSSINCHCSADCASPSA